MKMYAFQERSPASPLLHISEARAGYTYYSIHGRRPMKAMLNVKRPHFAFIGAMEGRQHGYTRIPDHPGGTGIVHDLYQDEVAQLPRIRFFVLNRWLSFDIADSSIEVPIRIEDGSRRYLVADNLLWLKAARGPFILKNLLVVEIWDTHDVKDDDPKRRAFQRGNIPAIQIKTHRHIDNATFLSGAEVTELRYEIRHELANLNRIGNLWLPFLKGWSEPPPATWPEDVLDKPLVWYSWFEQMGSES